MASRKGGYGMVTRATLQNNSRAQNVGLSDGPASFPFSNARLVGCEHSFHPIKVV